MAGNASTPFASSTAGVSLRLRSLNLELGSTPVRPSRSGVRDATTWIGPRTRSSHGSGTSVGTGLPSGPVVGEGPGVGEASAMGEPGADVEAGWAGGFVARTVATRTTTRTGTTVLNIGRPLTLSA